MKSVFFYLREHAKWVLLYASCVVLMVMLLLGNRVESFEIVYATVLLLVSLAVVLIIDFILYTRKQKRLQELEWYLGSISEYLGPPKGQQEAAYQRLIALLEEQMVKNQNSMNGKMTDLREYYAMWVHQIKTPISALRLLLQEKAGQVDTAGEQDELFRIEQYVEMALQYVRLDSETTDFLFQKTDLDAVLREAIHKYAGLFVRKKVKLQYEGVRTSVITDEKWLTFVVEQLLSNAIKYAPRGTVSIYLSGENTLVLEDDGMGIRAEDLPRVMEKGYTGYNGHNHKSSTGIGLYLCHRIMKKMNHGLRIESEEGKGTRVYLTFPDSNLTEV